MLRLGNFPVIAIDSPLETRFARLKSRSRSDDLTDISELESRDDRESSFGLRTAMDLASIRVENCGSLEEYRREVQVTLTRIIGEK